MVQTSASLIPQSNMKCPTLAAALFLHTLSAACQGPPAFNITAISAKNNASRLECWQLDAEPVFSRAATNFDLGEFGDSFVGILPPRTTSDGTLTNAQVVQYAFHLLPAWRFNATDEPKGIPL